jgi:EAL domain-containing protein (putative c-di-GMP-specific phosphodiesterase class I)
LADGFADLMSETMGRVTAMRDTVSTGGFSLVFQPIVDLKTRQVHHFEALTRFADGQSPYEFITFSEQIGMIAEIDLAVCEKVLRLMDRHRGGAPVAVNISGRSLQSPQFMQRLARLMADRSHDRAKFMFEITESSAIENLDEVNVFLQALRKAGHRICLDDFGAGFTAYTYLRRFEVDFVKLDGPFLKSGMANPRDRALLKSVCQVCTELDTLTIGEMIETREEAYAAAGLGITHGQGYFFGRPAPAQGLPVLPPAAVARR